MRTRYTGYTDIQETVSFAQHPCGSDCKSRECFLKRNVFRLDLKEGRLTWGITLRFGEGREFQVTSPMYETCSCTGYPNTKTSVHFVSRPAITHKDKTNNEFWDCVTIKMFLLSPDNTSNEVSLLRTSC